MSLATRIAALETVLTAGAALRKPPLVLYDGNVDVANAGTAGWETKLTVPVPAALLDANGAQLWIRSRAKNAANGNSKGSRVQLGGVDLGTNTHAGNGTPTEWDIWIRRDGAATGKAHARFLYGNTSIYVYDEAVVTPTWANAQSLTFDVHGPSAIADITLRHVTVIYVPAVT